MMETQIQKKILKRIRLINWQYFTDETISLKGSTLISGVNTSGKTTILDAIQLVLTTNTQRFNLAANEKSSRDLKGYVRCKLGEEGKKYNRTGTVISNIALEFFEEGKNKYFVIGTYLYSHDEESKVDAKWYICECTLDDLQFIIDERPSTSAEFLQNGKKVEFIDRKNEAKTKILRRLGGLDERFFEMIHRAMAFKPVENVREFITTFLLPEENINIENLKQNIENVQNLDAMLQKCQELLTLLSIIDTKYQEILTNQKNRDINEILLLMAEQEKCQILLAEFKSCIRKNESELRSLEKKLNDTTEEKSIVENQILDTKDAINKSDVGRMAIEAQKQMDSIQQKINEEENHKRTLDSYLTKLHNYLSILKNINHAPISTEEFRQLSQPIAHESKTAVLEKLHKFNDSTGEELISYFYTLQQKQKKSKNKIRELQTRVQNLELRRLQYPESTTSLKSKIEQEFKRRGYSTTVHILCDILDVTNQKWANAVEAYFNTQKFNLIVEPDYFPIALDVYNKESIHSVGLVDTTRLKLDRVIDENSLAAIVDSKNIYAKAYSDYLLNRVIRCENIHDLNKNDIAITADCILYQGFVVKRLDPRTYRNPYIGQNAYKVQLENTKQELSQTINDDAAIEQEFAGYKALKAAKDECNIALISDYMDSPLQLVSLQKRYEENKKIVEDAKKDQSLMELNFKLEELTKTKDELSKQISQLQERKSALKLRIESDTEKANNTEEEVQAKTVELNNLSVTNAVAYQEAESKYALNRKTKEPPLIIKNFTPQRSQFQNERDSLLDSLRNLQFTYNQKAGSDLKTGLEDIDSFLQEKQKLETITIVDFQSKLIKTRKQCEEIFKSDFLSKMKEQIGEARDLFKSLNRELEAIPYGEDTYRFTIESNSKKENLYKMIMSDNNHGSTDNLWTSSFESDFKDEIDELFNKLMTKDDTEDKVVKEYTDYRSYLDFDIKITKTNGSVLRFSKISGEKSGGETQVPFYVAIAASFYQLYSFGNSIHLMLLDEAFEKMDEERIRSMMELFKKLNLQVILITPPLKVEVIKDAVDSVIITNRIEHQSYAMEMEY